MNDKIEDLANLAYERELNRELSRLQQHLELYRNRENKFFQMTDMQFKFMQEASDEILQLYDHLAPDQAVSRAVALGLLRREEIPCEVRDAIRLSQGGSGASRARWRRRGEGNQGRISNVV